MYIYRTVSKRGQQDHFFSGHNLGKFKEALLKCILIKNIPNYPLEIMNKLFLIMKY
jgi:hypothetical protein